jgi:chromosome segregation ATPase
LNLFGNGQPPAQTPLNLAPTGEKNGPPVTPVQHREPVRPENIYDHISYYRQRLHEAEDANKAYLIRLQQADRSLEEKEQTLNLSQKEVRDALDEIEKTRADLKRLVKDREDLKSRFLEKNRALENDLERALEALEECYRQLQRSAPKGTAEREEPGLLNLR